MDDEKQLIEMCLAGDNEAFAILVNRFEANAKALAWNITGNAEDAMEISQDAFLQAFKNLHLFDQNKPFKNWLLGITIKRSIDKIRKQKTFLNFFSRYSREVPTAKDEIKPIEESPIFHHLLKQLNERERTALSLQVNENYTAKEIGQLLNCSENSVRVTLFNAKKKLKKKLRITDKTGKKQSNSANPGKTHKTDEVVP